MRFHSIDEGEGKFRIRYDDGTGADQLPYLPGVAKAQGPLTRIVHAAVTSGRAAQRDNNGDLWWPTKADRDRALAAARRAANR